MNRRTAAIGIGFAAALGFAACSESLPAHPAGGEPDARAGAAPTAAVAESPITATPSATAAPRGASESPSAAAAPAASAATPAGGKPCATSKDCGPHELCSGDAGCDAVWTCVPDRPCTRDLVKYCGCDGKTFGSSSTCAMKKYAARGPCAP